MTNKPNHQHPRSGFSLLEMALLLVLFGAMAAAAVWLGGGALTQQTGALTERKLATLTLALTRYATLNQRLPCPADSTLATTHASFGLEAANAGACTGGSPAATSAGGEAVMGMVPFATLGLTPADGLDGWSQRIVYYVDRRFTADNAATIYPLTDGTIGAIEIRNASGTARTTQALFALISFGANGHGATTANGTIPNAATTDIQEQENNHRDATGTATALNAILIQRETTPTFDDVIAYSQRSALR